MSINKNNNSLTDSIILDLYNKYIQWAKYIPFSLIHKSNLIKE